MISGKALCLFTVFVLPFRLVFSQVVISEVMFDPSGSENSDEFVELVNVSHGETIDLRGWRLGDGTGDDVLKDAGNGLRLSPNQYAIILDPDYFGQSTSYDSLIPGETLVLTLEGNTLGSGGLSNANSETVTILDSEGRVVEQYIYHTGNKPGYSDERIDLNGSNGPENWIESEIFLGTPGFRNSAAKVQFNLKIFDLFFAESAPGGFWNAVVCNDGTGTIASFYIQFYEDADLDSVFEEDEEIGSVSHEDSLAPGDSTVIALRWDAHPGVHFVCAQAVYNVDEKPEDNIKYCRIFLGYPKNALIINEIMYNPGPGEGEWIEIFNAQSSDVSLMNWKISDQDTMHRVELFNSSNIIPAGGYFVIASDSSMFWRYSEFTERIRVSSKFPSFNNDSDSVILYDPSGNRIDEVTYYSRWGNEKGISLERIDPRRGSNDGSNWHSSISTKGATPCESNSLGGIETVQAGTIDIQPNPFVPDGKGLGEVAVISFNLPFESAFVHLRIFDIRGRTIKHLERGRLCGKVGRYVWDGRDNQDKPVSIGQYIVVFEASEQNGGRTTNGRSVIVLARRL
jgi:hypothetical protein